ncbi:hypothetical protein FSP39_018453 [Pinctada imbricata]|uniref:Uncharacterized protein n=1 Tax=Pinctada imbricata TaxID=66713 RepID=A0AA88Y3Z3_PINIB|nr:hypothetical protein FSP39_018453 [Pinctada imbricata]
MHLRPSLFIVIFAVLDLVTGTDPCPLVQCQCYQSSDDTTKRVIDCRDINSGGDITNIVNVATPTNEVFYELALQRSRITSVGPNVFQGLKFVKLDLTENFITSFDIDAFSGLQNDLRIVRLEASGSVSFPFQAMQNLTGLQEIYLKDFEQQGLDSSTKFEYFPNLQKLSMIRSNIQFISRSAFDGKLTNLRELEFTHNPSVSSFPVPAIRNLRTLTKLTWTFNDMDQTSPQMFSQLTNLVELDLSHNKINSLADNWYTGITSKLEFLNLQANNLSTATIQSMGTPDWPKLHQLNLAVNNLQDFPSGFFSKMPDLAYLGLGSNKLTTLRSTYFTGLANMYSLDFHENFIASVESGALAHMPLLRSVNLENQNVATLNFSAGSISGAEGIEQLYLINTPVIQNEMWGAIRKMTNLTELHLTRTRITSIPDLVFQNHQRLVLLDIEGNTLGSVTQAMFHGLASSLESISLTNTGIQTIGECVFKDFNKLKTIHLGQNSLTCDCKLHWLYDWIQNFQRTLY